MRSSVSCRAPCRCSSGLPTCSFRLPILGRIFRSVVPVANYVDVEQLDRIRRYEWTLLDTLDMIGPRYDRPQREHELTGALVRAGLVDVRRLSNPGLNLAGTRPSA